MMTFDEFFPNAPDGAGAGPPDVVRLNETPVVLNVFTDRLAAVTTHYVDHPNYRGEVRCNAGPEARCLLCDLRYRATRRAILAVYDVAGGLVKALPISDTLSPHALGPQIQAELQRGGLDERSLLVSRVSTRFRVESMPARAGQDRGERAIADFLRLLEAGQVSLEAAIPARPNLQLWDIPELERLAGAMGLSRTDYAGDGRAEVPTP